MATKQQIDYSNVSLIKECTRQDCLHLKFRYGYCKLHAVEFEEWKDRGAARKMNAPFTVKGYKLVKRQAN